MNLMMIFFYVGDKGGVVYDVLSTSSHKSNNSVTFTHLATMLLLHTLACQLLQLASQFLWLLLRLVSISLAD
jgi:hypothetical protein